MPGMLVPRGAGGYTPPGYGGGGIGGAGGVGGTGGLNIPPPPALSSGTPPPITNDAGSDPNLQGLADRINKRLDDPMGSTGRAIDVATSNIRDANEGRRKAVSGMLARRGVLASSSIPEFGEAAIQRNEAADVNKASTNIALGRERDNDQMLLGAAGALSAPGNAARADRSLGLQQWEAAEQARQAHDRAALDQWMGTLSLIGSLGNL
jgi:hypothetical protein